MKNIALLISFILFLGLSSFAITDPKPEMTQTAYQEGWADGWCEGWKDVKGQYAYCPYTPYAPYPDYSCNSGYKCGYNRGFKYGMCKAQERQNCKK